MAAPAPGAAVRSLVRLMPGMSMLAESGVLLVACRLDEYGLRLACRRRHRSAARSPAALPPWP
jgi:hypothetical protein